MLTPRLELIASKVKDDASIIDVGTDHGYIPIYLAGRGRVKKALATDVNRGPLSRAEENIKLHNTGDKVSTALANGLNGIDTKSYDTVIIAGMGGILISEIMEQTDNTDLAFILQPMTAAEELRRYLYQKSYEIVDEELVAEGEKLYTVIVAKKGKKSDYEELDLYIGKKLFEKNDPLLYECINRLKKKLVTIINGISKSSNQENIDYYKKLLERIEMTGNDYKN
ncbi:MAG: SAM-dependent methyltransferase [Clostridia bacterium]|nr:SAM-dependent methyltransferase [Clostridia bacterium]